MAYVVDESESSLTIIIVIVALYSIAILCSAVTMIQNYTILLHYGDDLLVNEYDRTTYYCNNKGCG